MERSDLFSLIGKQKKIAHLIAGHPVGLSVCLSVRLSVRPTQKLEKSQRNLYWGQGGARYLDSWVQTADYVHKCTVSES